MKNNSRKLIFGICAFLLATLSLGSCNSDDYLVDGGTSNPYFDGNVMQYLESRLDLFKDLVKVIKLTKWEDILTNEEVTFFAPTDFTIAKSVERMNYYLYNYQGMDKITELSQVKPAVWEDPNNYQQADTGTKMIDLGRNTRSIRQQLVRFPDRLISLTTVVTR